MRQKDYEKFDQYARDVMNYFRELKKERDLTREEERLLMRSLSVRRDISSAQMRLLDKQEAVRQNNREKQKANLFATAEIVYEGIVDDIYEPVYASDYKELRKKMSKYANLTPKEKDMATVNTYENRALSKKEKWVRQNTFCNDTWSFGVWFCAETVIFCEKPNANKMEGE